VLGAVIVLLGAAIGELDALAGTRRRFDRDDALDLLAFIRASLSSAA
jgi:hypothetical protein